MAAERGMDDRIKHIKLYRALVKGELESVKKLLKETPRLLYAKISTIGETPLHIAVSHGHQHLAIELLKRMDPSSSSRSRVEKLSIKDEYGDTPLHIAARGLNTNIASHLLFRSYSLMRLEDADGHVPLTLAAIYGNKYMLEIFGSERLYEYLEPEKSTIFTDFIKCKKFGFALDIYSPGELELKTCKEDLYIMAEMVPVFSTANQLTKFERWLYDSIPMFEGEYTGAAMACLMYKVMALALYEIVIRKEIFIMKIENMKALELLSKMCSPIWTFDSNYSEVYFEAIKRAVKCGNAEFVEEVLRSNPALLWGNKESGSIFHIAVAFRQEKIWNLIYGLTIEQRNKIIGTLVESKNNMLHIAAYPLVTDEASKKEDEQRLWKILGKAPGAFMKLQRELQWYKEVERMVPSSYKKLANKNGETPPQLWSKWHSELVKDGEKWMREIASSCTIVAALIVTVMFAAAFTLPGGVKEDSGNPHFLQRNSFMVFIISDALSLFSSVTAVLMFLNIVTSRFEEEDFLKALPKRLIIGHFALLLSIVSMMVTFGATLVIVLGERTLVIVLGERIRWSVILVSLASVPVILFYLLQIPLFLDLVSSTYGGIFNRKTKCSFFNNPNDYFPPEPEPGVSSHV